MAAALSHRTGNATASGQARRGGVHRKSREWPESALPLRSPGPPVGMDSVWKPITGGISVHMLVGYMRVSTDGDRQVLDLQRDALLSTEVDERHLFEDRASGSRDDRTGLATALAFLKPGDCLVVWKLDRLGRSLSHLLATVNDLKERGVAFRSLTEQMDTTTPQGEFLFHVFGALAQFERSLTQERVRAGLEAARRRGRQAATHALLGGRFGCRLWSRHRCR
jgi:hypothetical protein